MTWDCKGTVHHEKVQATMKKWRQSLPFYDLFATLTKHRPTLLWYWSPWCFLFPVFFSPSPFLLKRAPGGSEVDFHFLIVSDRRGCQLPGTFYRMKKYCSNLKITYNYTTRANFKRDFPKINLKIYNLLLQILS